MKVSSPIGDLPFEITKVRWKSGALVLEGEMGAWPARVVVSPNDVPKLLKMFRWPLAALVIILGIAVLWQQ